MNRHWAFAWILLGALGSGCAAPQSTSRLNVYRAGPRLPAEIRRVAVLPVTSNGDWESVEGAASLQPIFQTELGKTGAFELFTVSPEQMRAITGQPGWRSDEAFPADWCAKLQKATACDAVIFCQLTAYRPYPPLAIGWSLKLIDNRQQRTIWAVDQVFDSGEPAVAAAAREYYSQSICQRGVLRNPDSVLESPRWFGQYSAATALGTLPSR